MPFSPRVEAVAERTPEEVKIAWRAAFHGKNGSCTPEQKEIIAEWVRDRVLHSRLPNPLMEELWPPAYGRERHYESDMFRR